MVCAAESLGTQPCPRKMLKIVPLFQTTEATKRHVSVNMQWELSGNSSRLQRDPDRQKFSTIPELEWVKCILVPDRVYHNTSLW